jgi:hypothetical protein
MSLETWKAEFYPIEADKATNTDLEATLHSLKKWEGLRKDNLDKHNLVKINEFISNESIIDEKGNTLKITSSSCSLCKKYDNDCNECPLYRCGTATYGYWLITSDPEPMIKSLEELRDKLMTE